MPGLLLLYTGNVEISSFCAYVQRVLSYEPAGIVISAQGSPLDEESIALCDREGLPVIQIPGNLNVISFSKRFASVVARNFDESQRSEEWLRTVCYSDSYEPSVTMAEMFGYRPDYRYICLFVCDRNLETKDPLQAEIDASTMQSLLNRELAYKDVPCLGFSENGLYTVCFVPVRNDEEWHELRTRVTKTVALVRRLTNIKWMVWVGTLASEIRDFSRSFSNAVKLAELLTTLEANELISFYDDWYAHILLLRQPKTHLREHMEHVLKPILDKPELIDTLANYLVFGESLKTTAEKMCIHVNTLKYRVKRISELLDVDLGDSTVRFRLRIAITIWRYLHGSPVRIEVKWRASRGNDA